MADVQRFDTKFYDQKPKFSFLKAFSFLCVLLVLIGVVYSAIQYVSYKSFSTEGNSIEAKSFEVKQGESLESISQRLIDEGFIRDETIFTLPAYKIFLQFNPIDSNNIQAGFHQIPANATPKVVFENLRDKGCDEVQVTFREGWRIEEYAEELDKVFGQSSTRSSEFLSLAKNYTADITGLGLGFTPPSNLEGYLFPDTYRFCKDIKTFGIIEALLKNFNKKVYTALKPKIESSKFKLNEIINIAAMVEREARQIESKKNVAGIIINRLNNSIPLGIDATTQYEFGYSEEQKTWWRKGVELDLVIDTEHTYNTRRNLGLPPTPIANPGIDSIQAVLEPIITDNLYYITGNDNKMYYAKDQAGHEYNVCRYILESCE